MNNRSEEYAGKPGPSQMIDVIKLDFDHKEQWRYPAKVIQAENRAVIIEAHFDRSDVTVAGLLLSRGDRFLEIYFQDRWYNIFEVYSGSSGKIKGWYCNIARPVVIDQGSITYVDLALDLVVHPDGAQHVLDEQEFEQLGLEPEIKNKAFAALSELQTMFAEKPITFRVSSWLL